jgi:F-type H+-transporting ATPase subunit b
MKQGGLPQLDPTWFPSQLFWLAATFVVMYLIVARALLPKIQYVMDARESKRNGDLDAAAEMKSQAAKAQADYESSLKSARADAQKMVAEVTASIKQKAEEKNRDLDASLTAKIAASEKEITEAMQKAMENLKPAAAEVSAMVLEVILQKKVDAKAVEAAVAQQMKELV